jgi:hypothetical protein
MEQRSYGKRLIRTMRGIASMQKKNPWPISNPDEHNMDQEYLDKLDNAVKKTQVKSCLVLKEGALVYQYYKSNKISNMCSGSIHVLKVSFHPNWNRDR